VAYLALFNGYNPTKAIQDVIDVRLYKNIPGLLEKIPENFTWHNPSKAISCLIEAN